MNDHKNSTDKLVVTIEDAKGQLGLITPDALHNQLGLLTAADWRQAAQIYTKQSAGADGFYIEDNSAGMVTIHNDLRPAAVRAKETPMQATLNNFGADKSWAVPAGVMGGGDVAIGGYLAGGALLDGEVTTAALIAGAAGVALGGMALIGAGIFAGAYYDNTKLKPEAQSALKNDKTLMLNTNAP